MKKVFILLALILLVISGCSNLKIEDDKNKELEISGMQYGIGSIDDTDSLEEQKLTYDIIISNKGKTEVKRDSVEVVLSEWIKQKQIEKKITEITFDTESIVIKGYVIFDAKGLTKNEIINQQPFIDGVSISIVTDTEKKIFVKYQLH